MIQNLDLSYLLCSKRPLLVNIAVFDTTHAPSPLKKNNNQDTKHTNTCYHQKKFNTIQSPKLFFTTYQCPKFFLKRPSVCVCFV